MQIFYFVLAAALLGFTKTSIGGVGILAVLLMAMVFPGKASPGVLLPMLIIADIMAVIYFRRDCRWDIIAKLAPTSVVGVVIGFFIVDLVPTAVFEKLLGGLILALLVLGLVLQYKRVKPGAGNLFIYTVGIIAGAASMVANAAGPVFGVFLLQMGLSKQRFVGTRAWFFLLLNLFKVPFSANLGLITLDTLKLNLLSLPVIVAGAFLGVRVLKLIDLALFNWLIRIAVAVAAIRLLAF